MDWKDIVKEFSGIILGVILVGLGSLGFVYLQEDLWLSFSETAVIAGIVTLTVDPFLKKRLIREASKDIFYHLLGINLPEDVREALSDQLTHTDNYREDVEIEAHVETTATGALLTMTSRGKVIAAKTCSIKQRISFEESEHGELLAASLTGNGDSSKDYDIKSFTLEEKIGEPMVWEWYGPETKLKKGERVDSYIKYKIARGRSDFFVLNFATPVIKPRVRVSASPDLEITASVPHHTNGNQYIYEKVFLTADHIQIRWKPKSES